MTDEPIYQALEVLRKGGIILYPTDTVKGIGCDATNDEAVERIYRLKRSGGEKKACSYCWITRQKCRFLYQESPRYHGICTKWPTSR